MAKKVVDYGSRQVEVEVTPAMEQGTREVAQDMGAAIDGEGRIKMAEPGHAPGRARDTQFDARVASLRQRLAASPPVPATVFNFLPVPIVVNSPMQSVQGGVPAVKGKARYATRTWKDVDIVVNNLGDAGKEPRDFHPMQTAQAFEHEYPHGGVVGLPCLPEEADSNPRFKAALMDHERRAVTWMRERVADGERLWNMPDRYMRRNVNNVHRACGQRLFDLGLITALPEYMTAKIELDEKRPTCPKCGTTADSQRTLQCKCGWILDPAEALRQNVIDENDAALERLTRAQVKDLGVSAYVAETVDEKPERIKNGLPKPLSEAAMMAIEAEERAKVGA